MAAEKEIPQPDKLKRFAQSHTKIAGSKLFTYCLTQLQVSLSRIHNVQLWRRANAKKSRVQRFFRALKLCFSDISRLINACLILVQNIDTLTLYG
jgi:hypothetical protein